MTKNSSKRSGAIKAAHVALCAIHPILGSSPPAPLSRGVREAIVALYPELPRRTLYGLMSWLTSRPAYLKACSPGAPRFGLDGNAQGVVTPSEAAHASARLAAILEKQKA